jgi:hypothetical protein
MVFTGEWRIGVSVSRYSGLTVLRINYQAVIPLNHRTAAPFDNLHKDIYLSNNILKTIKDEIRS